MMNLLVVDDEFYIVKGLVKDIDSASLGLTRIFQAYNAQQARKILEEEKIDILLTDIEMPRGSGLELIQWCAREGRNPVTILLTGHQNFDYVKMAIELRCLNYLLKPIKKEQLNQTIETAVGEVIKKRDSEDKADLAEHWRQNSQTRAANFWSRLLSNEIPPESQRILGELKEQQLPSEWLDQTFHFCLFCLRKAPESKEKVGSVTAALTRIIFQETLFTEEVSLVKLEDFTYLAPILSSASLTYGQCCFELEKLIARISEILNSQISIYVSDIHSLVEASACLTELKKIKNTVRTIGNRLIPVKMIKNDRSLFDGSAGSLKDIPFKTWSQWLLQYQRELIVKDIRKKLEEGDKYLSSRKLILLYHGLIQTLFYTLSQKSMNGDTLFPDITSYENLDKAVSSMENFLSWVDSILYEAEKMLKAEENSSSLLKVVSEIVDANLNSNSLTRSYIADNIHMNPDYLSYLFHKKSGQSLVSFINARRIEKAKELLLSTNKTMSDIAESVGYSNIPYFYRQFKRNTGLTPKQFKESINKPRGSA